MTLEEAVETEKPKMSGESCKRLEKDGGGRRKRKNAGRGQRKMEEVRGGLKSQSREKNRGDRMKDETREHWWMS